MSTIIILFLISRTRVVLDRVMPNDTRRQSYLYTIVRTPCNRHAASCHTVRILKSQPRTGHTRAHNEPSSTHNALNHAVPHTPPPRSLTSRSEALVSRHDALLRQLHRPLRPCLSLLRARGWRRCIGFGGRVRWRRRSWMCRLAVWSRLGSVWCVVARSPLSPGCVLGVWCVPLACCWCWARAGF